jgi:hypothetical protein
LFALSSAVVSLYPIGRGNSMDFEKKIAGKFGEIWGDLGRFGE